MSSGPCVALDRGDAGGRRRRIGDVERGDADVGALGAQRGRGRFEPRRDRGR